MLVGKEESSIVVSSFQMEMSAMDWVSDAFTTTISSSSFTSGSTTTTFSPEPEPAPAPIQPDPHKCNYYINKNTNETQFLDLGNPYGGLPQNL